MTPRGADDCGWRNYPRPQGVLSLDCASPDYYAEADIMERVMAHEWERQMESFFHVPRELQTIGPDFNIEEAV